MKKLITTVCLMLVTLGVCLFLLLREGDDEQEGEMIEVHCAAGLRKPVEEVARMYEAEYGVKVMLNYGGSGQLYGGLKIRGGDVYIPADASYTRKGIEERVIIESIPLCYLTAGIVVPKGNPKGIKDLADLTRNDVKVAIADKSAAVGVFTHEVLQQADILDAIEKESVSKFPTVNEVATQVKLSVVDAGIIWDALMSQYENDIEFIHVPEFDAKRKRATAGVIKSSKKATEALRFAHYLSSKDKGAKIFQKHGYEALDGGSQQ